MIGFDFIKNKFRQDLQDYLDLFNFDLLVKPKIYNPLRGKSDCLGRGSVYL